MLKSKHTKPAAVRFGTIANMPLWSCKECANDQYAVDGDGHDVKPSQCTKCAKPTKFALDLGWAGSEHDYVLRALVALGWKLQWEVIAGLGVVPTVEIFDAIKHALKVRGVVEGQHATYEMTVDVLRVRDSVGEMVVTSNKAFGVWKHIRGSSALAKEPGHCFDPGLSLKP